MHRDHIPGNVSSCGCKHDKKCEFMLQRRRKSLPTSHETLQIFDVFAGPRNIFAYAELTGYNNGCVTFGSSFTIGTNINSP